MNILFLCVANFARSQMAEAIARQILPSAQYKIQSAGSEPSGRVHPLALRLIQQNKGDPQLHYSKSISSFF